MLSFILKRILLILPLSLGVTLICFILMNLNPSDPAEVTLRLNNIVIITPEAIEEMKKELNLDEPLHIQYFLWLKNIFEGNLGLSYETKEPVLNEFLKAFPITFYLAFISLILIAFFGLIIGILCAIYENSLFDKILRIFIFISASIPSFWLALLLIWVFSINFNILPSNGIENISGIILPAITLTIAYICTFVRIIRNSLIQIKNSLFITYAKARGLSKYQILKHQIKSTINPFIIAINMSIPRLLAGTVVIENIFALPGLGRLCVHAIFARDYPMIQAYIFFLAILFILFNLFADIWLQIRDPRLKQVK